MPEGTGPLRDLHPQILRRGAEQGSSISLQAQREACEAFIASQLHESGFCLRAGYGDGGFSAATTDRPALQRLLADITAGRASAIRSAASSPTSSPAVRYWNSARQRYHHLSARHSRPTCLCQPGPLVPARTTAENRGFST